jgi:hypothetical protein
MNFARGSERKAKMIAFLSVSENNRENIWFPSSTWEPG